jgi:diadenosine tetraphosphatase ApaH/serine/threonine PP2A family protein phosphatase
VRDVLADGDAVHEQLTPYRRVAVFGGVYANAPALAAALADIALRDVDAVCCLGDLGGFGPHPDRVVPLLQEAGVLAIQGNYDEALVRGMPDCGCGYGDPRDNYFARLSYAYTARHTSADSLRWLATLPRQRRLALGDRRVLLCHGSPRAINEFLWESTTPTGMATRLLADHDADVVLCTHTGIKWERRLPHGGRLVNVGALGRPENDGTTKVWYAVLTAGERPGDDVDVEFVPVAYDHEAHAREIERAGLPAEFAETIRTGWWTSCLEILPSRERARGRF